jgi:predicted nucleotidyltransferase component of viral defense system
VSAGHRYRDAAALRTAVEEHLRRRAHDAGIPLDRLRKEVAHQRLLARLAVAAPAGTWALKGGQALLARLGEDARATKDADASWRGALEHFGDVLDESLAVDLGDGFLFEATAPRRMTAETPEGGLRYTILARLDGREFERIQLDVNAVPDDRRPLEHLALRDLLDFAGIAPPTIPVIPVAQHLAEKLHAYTRDYGQRSNSRPRDLYDMLVIARSLPVPDSMMLRMTCRQTFELRRTPWPPAIPHPPDTWVAAWRSYVDDHDLPWRDLAAAGTALTVLWYPLLADEPPPGPSSWDAVSWSWVTGTGASIGAELGTSGEAARQRYGSRLDA